jgi:hypothetical protein
MSIEFIKLCLLMLVFCPLLVTNLRTGLVKNGMLTAMFFVGVLIAFFGSTFGAEPLKLSAPIGWILTAALLLGVAAYGIVPGGIAKFLIALLPWFPLHDYLFVITIGMGLATLIGYASSRKALIVPPIMLSALAVGLMPVLGFKPF